MGRPIEEGLPEERMIDRSFRHMAYTEEYNPQRFSTNQITTERVSEVLGIDYSLSVDTVTVLEEREINGDFDFYTYAWYSEQGGDPDNVFSFRYHTDGQRNYGGYSNSDYDEVATQFQTTYDSGERQELAMEAQSMIEELGWETQYQFNERLYGYNTDIVREDSLIPDGRLIGTWVTWTNMEPAEGNDEGVVATNNWNPTNQINPFAQQTLGPSRNITPTFLMQDTLIRYNEKYEKQNWVAEEIEIVDETTVRVQIRDGFTFHDGEPLTSEDVVWTFNKILETEPPAHKTSVTDRLESVEATGDSEVTFNLIEPYAPFTTLTFWRTPIVPSHYWETILEETGNQDTPWEVSFSDDRPLIGSGPFEYETWNQGERFEFTANKDHPIAPPSIDTRITRPLASTSAELESLQQGEYGYLDYWFGSNEQLSSTIEQTDNLGLFTRLDNTREATWLNVSNPDPNPPLTDVSFRQAYSAIVASLQPIFIEEVYGGYGQRAHSPITALVQFWHNPENPWFDGGPQAAIEILADAGYRWDPDGNMYAPE
jgi:peptide/nickel transport system substrate-binding protein